MEPETVRTGIDRSAQAGELGQPFVAGSEPEPSGSEGTRGGVVDGHVIEGNFRQWFFDGCPSLKVLGERRSANL